MYRFIDTVDQPGEYNLPAEAMSINGQYIEHLIDGYRTIAVSGREVLGADIEEREIKSVNGTAFLYKQYPARDIEVSYRIMSATAQELVEKCNELNKILNVEEAQIIFADEPDKYFVGTPSAVKLPEPGKLNIIASFTIHCADPFKYAVEQKEFTATADENGVLSVDIENCGSVPAAIDYEITMAGENGFIGIVSENGAMQYGYVDEPDDREATRSECLISIAGQSDFATKMLASDYASRNVAWTGGLPNTPLTWCGEVGAYNYKNEYGTKTWNCLKMTKQGAPPGSVNNGQWYGANLSLDIPAKSDGTQPESFTVETRAWFSGSTPAQRGGAMLVCIDEDDEMLAALWWYDGSTSVHSGYCNYYVGGHGKTYSLGDYGSGVSGGAGIKTRVNGGGPVSIRKTGGKISLNYMGTTKTYHFSDIESKKLKKVVLGYTQVKPTTNLTTRLDFLNFFRVTADNVSYLEDVPNRYQSGDVITINGDAGTVYKNGENAVEDEMIGTEYFDADVGRTKVQILKSSWASDVTARAYIRERWL